MNRRFSRICLIAAALLAAACSHHNAELAELAAAGDDAAQYELGRRLLTGQKGMPTDHALAFAWLQQAALQGNPQAMATVGLCHERGLGTPVSEEQAALWYRKAVDEGYMTACAPLIKMAARRGDTEGLAAALTPPAERGAPAAQILLATLYLNSPDPRKQEEAVRYLRFAAMQGNARACLLMGLCYVDGRGVPMNLVLARGWFQNAKEAGHAEADDCLKMLDAQS